ncbi:uncharacterized protein BHQ10_005580 [Talaromyces amestolkiae]|uniref:Uncharacterized protein n=1 Tax=Talaromyces amestolkiae TaxID=1196081 RepID=A0A364L193_TALAM|nr:uncharacterized protein BHQ10_005580 [Talaromyces amestolkiae]RAO69568.1 hypothetical protein BHQ10_005580 [Talaromyces amestolkiae]
MQFFTSLTALFLATMAFGAVIDTRTDSSDLSLDKTVESATCSPKGGDCVEGALACCEGLQCFIPPTSGWEPKEVPTGQGACI